MAEEVVIKVRVDTKDADKKVKGVEKSIDKLGVSAKKTSNKTKGFSNSINAGFSAMPAFIQGAISSLRAFKLALISTGVGAIVVTLGL